MLGENIRLKRNLLKMTQVELAKKIGVSSQVISNWERGYTPDISSSDLAKLSNALQCSTDDLLGKLAGDMIVSRAETSQMGQSFLNEKFIHDFSKAKSICPTEADIELRRMLRYNKICIDDLSQEEAFHLVERIKHIMLSNSDSIDENIKQAQSSISLDNAIKVITYGTFEPVPIIGSVRAGMGGIAFEEPLGYHYVIADSLPNKNSSYCLKVRGDSMCPYLLPDDLVLFQENPDVASGSLAIVIVDGGEGTVKWLKRGEGFIRLEAENPYYPAREFSGDELQDIRIVGPVIEVIRKPVKKNGLISK